MGYAAPEWYADFYINSIFLGREFIAFIRLSKMVHDSPEV